MAQQQSKAKNYKRATPEGKKAAQKIRTARNKLTAEKRKARRIARQQEAGTWHPVGKLARSWRDNNGKKHPYRSPAAVARHNRRKARAGRNQNPVRAVVQQTARELNK